MGALEPWHLVIILVIVMVLFGAGRLSEIGGALGRGIREFKSATQDEPPAPVAPATTTTTAQPPAAPQVLPPAPNACLSCGTVNPGTQNFCGQCGAPLTR